MRAFLPIFLCCALGSAALAQSGDPLAWRNAALSADRRADLLVAAMKEDEKLVVVTSYFGTQDQRIFFFLKGRGS